MPHWLSVGDIIVILGFGSMYLHRRITGEVSKPFREWRKELEQGVKRVEARIAIMDSEVAVLKSFKQQITEERKQQADNLLRISEGLSGLKGEFRLIEELLKDAIRNISRPVG